MERNIQIAMNAILVCCNIPDLAGLYPVTAEHLAYLRRGLHNGGCTCIPTWYGVEGEAVKIQVVNEGQVPCSGNISTKAYHQCLIPLRLPGGRSSSPKVQVPSHVHTLLTGYEPSKAHSDAFHEPIIPGSDSSNWNQHLT